MNFKRYLYATRHTRHSPPIRHAVLRNKPSHDGLLYSLSMFISVRLSSHGLGNPGWNPSPSAAEWLRLRIREFHNTRTPVMDLD